jgi:hypothetical protein
MSLGHTAYGLEIYTAALREKDARLAQKLGQLQPFVAVFSQGCTGQLGPLGPTQHLSRLTPRTRRCEWFGAVRCGLDFRAVLEFAPEAIAHRCKVHTGTIGMVHPGNLFRFLCIATTVGVKFAH